MSERLVGLGHAVHFFLALDGGAGVVGGVHQLGSQAFGHGLFTAFPGEVNDPAQGQGLTALGTDFNRYLIGGTAYTAGFDFQLRGNVVQGFLENVGGGLAGFGGNRLKSLIADVLRNSALSVQHNLINKLCNNRGPVNRIRKYFTFRYKTATGHRFPSSIFFLM